MKSTPKIQIHNGKANYQMKHDELFLSFSKMIFINFLLINFKIS